MIGDQLSHALELKGWSVTRAAEESGVERTFLSRLLTGKVPPRKRSGRQSARQDDRYRKLAAALGLEPKAFVDAVYQAQTGGGSCALSVHYPRFGGLLRRHLPLRDATTVRNCLRACLKAVSPERSGDWMKAVEDRASQPVNRRHEPAVSCSFFGDLREPDPSLGRSPDLSTVQGLCARVADELGEPNTVEAKSSQESRDLAELSMLFRELAEVRMD